MKTKVMPVFAILLTLAIALVSIAGCETNNIAEDDSLEETATNGIDESDTTSETTTESISEFTSSTSDDSSVENSVPDITGMTAAELKRFALNYEINSVRILTYVGEVPTTAAEHEFVWNVQNFGDFDITIVYSFCYNLVDPEDPDFFNPDVQELKTEVVKIYAPAHSEGVYLPEPGYKNRSGNDAVDDGGVYLGIEFAGVYYTWDELWS